MAVRASTWSRAFIVGPGAPGGVRLPCPWADEFRIASLFQDGIRRFPSGGRRHERRLKECRATAKEKKKRTRAIYRSQQTG